MLSTGSREGASTLKAELLRRLKRLVQSIIRKTTQNECLKREINEAR